jgi:hypothetical protein
LTLSTSFEVTVVHSFPSDLTILNAPQSTVEGATIFSKDSYVTLELTDSFGNRITCSNDTQEELTLLYDTTYDGKTICNPVEMQGIYVITVSLFQGCYDLGGCDPSEASTSATLLGTTSENTYRGVASFSSMSINKPGNGFKLKFTTVINYGTSILSAVSTSFDILSSSYNQISVSCYEKTSYTPNQKFEPQPKVSGVFYSFNVMNDNTMEKRVVRSNTNEVCFAPGRCDPETMWYAQVLVYSGPDPGLFSCKHGLADSCLSAQGETTVAFANNSAEFSDLRAPSFVGQVTLRIALQGPSETSGFYVDCPPISVQAGTAFSIDVITQPSQQGIAGASLLVQPSLKVYDKYGNLVDNHKVTVKAGLCQSDSGSGFVCETWDHGSCTSLTMNDDNELVGLKKACTFERNHLEMDSACSVTGVLTFSDLKITRAGSGYMLFFSVEGNNLLNASSTMIDIAPCLASTIAPLEGALVQEVSF